MLKYKFYIKAFFFILVISGLVGFANSRNLARKITKVEVAFEQGDNLYINSESVNKLIVEAAGNLLNKKKKVVVLNDIEQTIEKNAMVKKAEVYVTVDGALLARVSQRKPIARILANGKSTYLDSRGKKMPLSTIYSARVPIVTGVLSDKDLEQVYQFVSKVLVSDFMKKQVVGIRINSDGEFVLKTRMGNQVIEFGKLKNYETKIKKLEAFYQKATKDNSLKTYHKINLKFKDQVVSTKHKSL